MEETNTNPSETTQTGGTTMQTTTAATFINENSGFFSGIMPAHDDVDQYFAPEAFAAMFGDDTLPAGLTYESLRETAHDMIDERAAIEAASKMQA